MADYCAHLYALARPVIKQIENKQKLDLRQFERFLDFCTTAINSAGYDLTRYDDDLLDLPYPEAVIKFQEEMVNLKHHLDPVFTWATYGYVVDCILAYQKRSAMLEHLKVRFLNENIRKIVSKLNQIREENRRARKKHTEIIRIHRGKDIPFYTFHFGNMTWDRRFNIEFNSLDAAILSLVYIEDEFKHWMQKQSPSNL